MCVLFLLFVFFCFVLFCLVRHVHALLGDYKEPSAPLIQRQINRPLVPHLIVLLFCHVRRRSRNRGDRTESVFVLHNLGGGVCHSAPALPRRRPPAVSVTQSESQVRTPYCRVSRTRHDTDEGQTALLGRRNSPLTKSGAHEFIHYIVNSFQSVNSLSLK